MRLLYICALVLYQTLFAGICNAQNGGNIFWNKASLTGKDSKLSAMGGIAGINHKVFELGISGGLQWNLSGDLNSAVVNSSVFAPATSTTGGLFGSMVKLLGGPFTILDKTTQVDATYFKKAGIFFGHAVNKSMQVNINIIESWGVMKGETHASVLSLSSPSAKPDTVLIGFGGKASNTDMDISIRKYVFGNSFKPFVSGGLLVGYTQNKIQKIDYKAGSLDYNTLEHFFRGGIGLSVGTRLNIGDLIFVEAGEHLKFLIAGKGHKGLTDYIELTAGIRF